MTFTPWLLSGSCSIRRVHVGTAYIGAVGSDHGVVDGRKFFSKTNKIIFSYVAPKLVD